VFLPITPTYQQFGLYVLSELLESCVRNIDFVLDLHFLDTIYWAKNKRTIIKRHSYRFVCKRSNIWDILVVK